MFKILRLNSFENYLLVACLAGGVRRWTQAEDAELRSERTGDRLQVDRSGGSLLAKFPE